MPTRHRGTDVEVRALNAYICLMRAADSVTERTSAPMKDAGLSVSQFGALEALLHHGPLHQKDVAKKILKTGGNVVLVARNLEKRGLIECSTDADDRRFHTLSLTPAGRILAKRVFGKVLERIVAEMGLLEAEKQETLRGLCRKVGLGNRN